MYMYMYRLIRIVEHTSVLASLYLKGVVVK